LFYVCIAILLEVGYILVFGGVSWLFIVCYFGIVAYVVWFACDVDLVWF